MVKGIFAMLLVYLVFGGIHIASILVVIIDCIQYIKD
jgi:hypothetical protein